MLQRWQPPSNGDCWRINIFTAENELILDSTHWGIHPEAEFEPWTLYIRDGIVVNIGFLFRLDAVAGTAEALQALENLIGLTWEKVW